MDTARSSRGYRMTSQSSIGRSRAWWGVIVCLMSYGVSLVCCDCDTMELIIQSEQCMQPLSTTNNLTLQGGITAHTWKASCSLYNTSLACVENLVRHCPKDTEPPVGESILTSLRSGMGQLCQRDNKTFKRYLEHAGCYARQATATVNCMNVFTTEIEEILSTALEDEMTDLMCEAFNKLINDCINEVIRSNCGSDAAQLFDNLVKAQVPSHVSGVCGHSEDTPGPSNSPGGAAAVTSSTAMLLLLPVSLLLATRYTTTPPSSEWS